MLDHRTVVEGAEFLDLARRLARVHEQPDSGRMFKALYGLCTEAGSLLWRAITSGQLVADDTGYTAALTISTQRTTRRLTRSVPSDSV